MRGVFDEEEEMESAHRRDKELTLGWGTLLAMFFGLVLLCSLCFGLGYTVGHHGVKSAAVIAPTPPGEQEPLQANGTIPKPSAIAQDVVTPPQTAAAESLPAAASGPAPVQAAHEPVNAAPVPTSAPQTVASSVQQPQVHPAMTPPANSTQTQSSAAAVRPAFAPQGSIMVQIAAVANTEDAEVLVNALRKRNYAVTAHHEPEDNLIHVRIGPFSTPAEANQWRMRLLNDGYNAIVQP
jgi:cell division septation protein DedD